LLVSLSVKEHTLSAGKSGRLWTGKRELRAVNVDVHRQNTKMHAGDVLEDTDAVLPAETEHIYLKILQAYSFSESSFILSAQEVNLCLAECGD